jgi:hypothetical protein
MFRQLSPQERKHVGTTTIRGTTFIKEALMDLPVFA